MSIIPPSLPDDANRQWKIITPPTIEPITKDEVKAFARIDGIDEDDLITEFIAAVREATEEYISRALLEQTIEMLIDFWPETDYLELPRPPLLSVTSVQYLYEDGTTEDYDSDNYYVVTESIPGQIVLRNGATPPINTNRYYKGIKITYKAGYGTAASSVPGAIRNAMKMWVANFYDTRQIGIEPPIEVKTLLNLFRVVKL